MKMAVGHGLKLQTSLSLNFDQAQELYRLGLNFDSSIYTCRTWDELINPSIS